MSSVELRLLVAELEVQALVRLQSVLEVNVGLRVELVLVIVGLQHLFSNSEW